jgi:hypothetical protein
MATPTGVSLVANRLKHLIETLVAIRVITRELVALCPEVRYSRFREEPIPFVSVRDPQRFAGYGGVRLI